AFEPDPDIYLRLVRNLSSFSWAQAQNAAVWHHGGTLEFERSFLPGESGWGSVTAVRDFKRGQHVTVRATSLDDWSPSAEISSLDLVKLDAEGAELHVIAGARSVLQRFRPTLILEVSAPLLMQGGSSPSELIAELQRLDYSICILDGFRVLPYSPISND